MHTEEEKKIRLDAAAAAAQSTWDSRGTVDKRIKKRVVRTTLFPRGFLNTFRCERIRENSIETIIDQMDDNVRVD